MRAWDTQVRAAAVGFDWPEITPVFDKILEEVEEILHAHDAGDLAHAQEELGDLLFAAVNLARFLQVSPAEALNRTIDRFEHRFSRVCEIVQAAGKKPVDCTLAELDAAWEQAKKESRHA